jgi:glycosyltransferase involved in cell wall biosynthesis
VHHFAAAAARQRLISATVRPQNRVIFVSAMTTGQWGGSEELWSQTALDLVSRGFSVSASVIEWTPLSARVLDLRARGVHLQVRPRSYSWSKQPLRRIASRHKDATVMEVEQLIALTSPALVVLSEGGPLPPLDLLELCAARKVPFVTISQANSVGTWYSDDHANRYRVVVPNALRCFFVSRANWRLAEKQIGDPIRNGEVIWNPVNVPFDASPAWPARGEGGELRFACVGRLHPPSKGQDILLEVLAAQAWKGRPWRLNVYGEGPMRQVLERLAQNLGLSDRVTFAGFAPVEEIWAANHVLIMPSRYEGLPLAMVEAMLCARPVVATDVAGHAEIIEDGVTGFLADAPTAGSIFGALERLWERRGEAEEIGRAGARRIRQLMPPDPVRMFSERLKQLAGLTEPG